MEYLTMRLMIQVVEAPTSGTDWTQIIVTIVVTFGVCFGATMSFLGVRASKRTQKSNTEDHGQVTAAIQALADKIDHLGGRIHDVGQNVGTLRDQFVGHLQHHLDRDSHGS
jgi:Na+(H+)/acetate symporter ActP